MIQSFTRVQKNGFLKLFEETFNLLFDDLCDYAFTYLKDRERARDAVQYIFLKWWEKRESIEINQNVKSYLYTAVCNHCLNSIRDGKVRNARMANFSKNLVEEVPFVDSIVYQEVNTLINQTIHSLPKQCQLIFCMSRFDNLTYQQISDKLGVSPKTVEAQITKALKILRDKMKANN